MERRGGILRFIRIPGEPGFNGLNSGEVEYLSLLPSLVLVEHEVYLGLAGKREG